ncbi:MAG TPA: 50S ribosomal protein L11 methyltransferase [Usitatibacter sp.]|jgi:ribosomal protein L11 methyltransferase|nr:50S ribosomal protein L11 methyltransferase [Usitatibacter sp.]
MPWQRIELVIAGEEAEAFCEVLAGMGAISTEVGDADEGTVRERAVYAEPGADSAPWPHARVVALFDASADAPAAVRNALDRLDLTALDGPRFDSLEDADWVAVTQRQFAPIRAGERLWIVPSWSEPPDPGAINVSLDPGSAFGTGSHPTTRLCLRWLESHVRPGDVVIDYGCGSGILAIAALKLGAARAVATDIDPLALAAARYNSRVNGVALEVVDAHDAIGVASHATVANILANPLRMLAPVLAAHTRPGGWIALSGILAAQAEGVIAAYAPYARMRIDSDEADWVLLTGRLEDTPC